MKEKGVTVGTSNQPIPEYDEVRIYHTLYAKVWFLTAAVSFLGNV